jgi:hypothetical protein
VPTATQQSHCTANIPALFGDKTRVKQDISARFQVTEQQKLKYDFILLFPVDDVF